MRAVPPLASSCGENISKNSTACLSPGVASSGTVTPNFTGARSPGAKSM